MNISKIIVTIGIIIGFIFLFGMITYNSKNNGSSSPGILGIILVVGLVAGIKAVWKKPNNDDKDKHQLDKTK